MSHVDCLTSLSVMVLSLAITHAGGNWHPDDILTNHGNHAEPGFLVSASSTPRHCSSDIQNVANKTTFSIYLLKDRILHGQDESDNNDDRIVEEDCPRETHTSRPSVHESVQCSDESTTRMLKNQLIGLKLG